MPMPTLRGGFVLRMGCTNYVKNHMCTGGNLRISTASKRQEVRVLQKKQVNDLRFLI